MASRKRPRMAASNVEPISGIDLDFNNPEDIYPRGSYRDTPVKVQKVLLRSDWAESGDGIPTIYASKTPHLAVKSFKDSNYAISEYILLRKCKHQNIVSAFGWHQNPQSSNPYLHSIVLEIGERSLFDLLHLQQELFPTDVEGSGNDNNYSMAHCLRWMTQLSDALSYLHKEVNIMHRDVKSLNILLFDESMNCKLCDFGHSRDMDTASSQELTTGSQVGTQLWRAPEVRKGKNDYTMNSDCFSLGVVMCEAVFRKKPSELLWLPNVLEAESELSSVSGSNDGQQKVYWNFWNFKEDKNETKVLQMAESPFNASHKEVLIQFAKILNGLLTDNVTKRTPATTLKSQLEDLQRKFRFEPKKLLATCTPNATGHQVSDSSSSGSVSGVSLKSRSVFYNFEFAPSTEEEYDKLAQRIIDVLNCLGSRVDKLCGIPESVRIEHTYKNLPWKPSNEGSTRSICVEHTICSQDINNVEALYDYCNNNIKHVDWLQNQFKDERWTALSEGLRVSISMETEKEEESARLEQPMQVD